MATPNAPLLYFENYSTSENRIRDSINAANTIVADSFLVFLMFPSPLRVNADILSYQGLSMLHSMGTAVLCCCTPLSLLTCKLGYVAFLSNTTWTEGLQAVSIWMIMALWGISGDPLVGAAVAYRCVLFVGFTLGNNLLCTSKSCRPHNIALL